MTPIKVELATWWKQLLCHHYYRFTNRITAFKPNGRTRQTHSGTCVLCGKKHTLTEWISSTGT